MSTATATAYRFWDGADWCVADEDGVRRGVVAACAHNAEPLDFDTAVSLSYAYLDRADIAEAAGDEETEYRWASWAEQLQLWAAKRVGAPGRVWSGYDLASGADRTVTMIVRRDAVHADDQAVSFAEMTRRN